MRIKNTAYGTLMGILAQIITVVFSYVLRKSFLDNLGVEYLGLYTLLSEIFGLLVALDCGISSCIFIQIHKPLVDKDWPKVRSIVGLIKLVYLVRAAAVGVVGFIVYWFLPLFTTNTTIDMKYIQYCYLIYLIFSVINYILIYNVFLLEALQKRYLTSIVLVSVNVIFIILNIFCIYYFKSFLLYLLITVLIPIVDNLICGRIVRTTNPEICRHNKILPEERKGFKGMLGMAFHTLSNIVVKNTDNILITMFLGLAVTGVYSNYKMIVANINAIVNQLTISAKDPMRNLMAEGNLFHINEMIDRLTFLYFWIAGFCSVALIVLLTPFISLAFGEIYLLDFWTVTLTVFTIYFPIVNYPMIDAYYFAGCYRTDRATPIWEILINLVMSVILGWKLGIPGVMVGTIIYYIYQTCKRSHKFYYLYFQSSCIKYLITFWRYFGAVVMAVIITKVVCLFIPTVTIASFILLMGICIIVPNCFFLILFYKTPQFLYFKQLFFTTITTFLGRWRKHYE